jgi:predicted nucleotidyltransferase
MAPTAAEAGERLAIGYALDRLWSETMGLPNGDSKEGPLRLIVDLLERERVPYALIGGVAVQLHTAEPRSTLDIDLAVPTYAHVPVEALRRAGFEHTGRHAHSDNWRAPGSGPLTQRTAVQFSAEETGIAAAVDHAAIVELGGGLRLRLATVADLIALKLLAAEEPRRRASKREHDVADVLALLEEHPELRTPTLVARLQDVRTRLVAGGLDIDPSVDET